MTKFVYFVTADDGGDNQTATCQSTSSQAWSGKTVGEDIVDFAYEPPAVGSVVNVQALSYAEYQGLNNIC